jgi:hypothetical protein
MRTPSIFTSLALLMVAAPAAGQPATDPPRVNFDRLMGRELRVRDRRGIERFGTLCAVGNGELRLVGPAGEVGVPVSGITQIDRRGDSVKEGLVLGMLWPIVAFARGVVQRYGTPDSETVRPTLVNEIPALPLSPTIMASIRGSSMSACPFHLIRKLAPGPPRASARWITNSTVDSGGSSAGLSM